MNVLGQIKDLLGDQSFHSWRIQELKDDMRRAFAEANGWRLTDSSFPTRVLARGKVHAGSWDAWTSLNNYGSDSFQHEFMDHREFFREKCKPYRAAAIVAHLYNDKADIHSWAEERSLVAHVPPLPKSSWYYPEVTLFVCYTRPGIVVNWLPEQL